MRLVGIVTKESVELVNPRIAELRSQVLLLGWAKSAYQLRLGLDALSTRLPDAKRLELQEVGAAASREVTGRLLVELSTFQHAELTA